MPHPHGFLKLMGRGLRKHCPQCGERNIFASWSQLRPRCPSCRYEFVREDGYWVGAIIVNLALTMAFFALIFAVGVLFTMPDPAWTPILVAALVMSLVFPIWFFPRSKTVWMGFDLYFIPNKY